MCSINVSSDVCFYRKDLIRVTSDRIFERRSRPRVYFYHLHGKVVRKALNTRISNTWGIFYCGFYLRDFRTKSLRITNDDWIFNCRSYVKIVDNTNQHLYSFTSERISEITVRNFEIVRVSRNIVQSTQAFTRVVVAVAIDSYIQSLIDVRIERQDIVVIFR